MGLDNSDSWQPSRHHYDASGSSASTQAQSNSRKRKADTSPPFNPKGKEVVDLTEDTPPKKRSKAAEPSEEKRLRRFRHAAPKTYHDVRHRALNQRMFVLDRQRRTTNSGEHPIEQIQLAGTTGNVYTITIDKVPSCNCPHALKGNQCKHVIYVLARVLRVPWELEYQVAFLTSELRSIFAQAPALPEEQGKESEEDGKRKALEGECPICCEDFETENTAEAVVYCKASCGNNIHKQCFEQWAATKSGQVVTCPFCRAKWEGDEDTLKKVVQMGRPNQEGYVNVASQLGLSGRRDYSTYNDFWMRRQFGYSF
ncbi:hypothetical protein BDY17DRAFT_328001 [Neohortaea acidophila]|uniref:Uncharacterized protein n=1 Tax=Neohortaea acidophila TaxID=245834 RepID=A0A6A6PI73_9PEZI|nr:uncharacterized protein BDY17DRAFT_328001 [Neohortaea acidophila]KAF2479223.1 hypothetical protein BDY17DRAFT_328001 [Neohortaea acidophila]